MFKYYYYIYNLLKYFCEFIKCLCVCFFSGNFQIGVFDSNCINCHILIKSDNLGKYCRFISGKILQFCETACIEIYEKRLSLCGFCQKELDDDGDFEVTI